MHYYVATNCSSSSFNWRVILITITETGSRKRRRKPVTQKAQHAMSTPSPSTKIVPLQKSPYASRPPPKAQKQPPLIPRLPRYLAKLTPNQNTDDKS